MFGVVVRLLRIELVLVVRVRIMGLWLGFTLRDSH